MTIGTNQINMIQLVGLPFEYIGMIFLVVVHPDVQFNRFSIKTKWCFNCTQSLNCY